MNQKYLAHGVMVLYFMSGMVLSLLGVESRLLRFGAEFETHFRRPFVTQKDLGEGVPPTRGNTSTALTSHSRP